MVDKLAQDYSVDSAVMKTYGRAEISFVRGQGCWLESEAGEQYLDCSSGIAVNTLGHTHPQMVSALIEQGKKLSMFRTCIEFRSKKMLRNRWLVWLTSARYFFVILVWRRQKRLSK